MHNVWIIPHRVNEAVFPQVAAKANACQGDFRFHTLPPDDTADSPLRSEAANYPDVFAYLHKRKAGLRAQPQDLLIAFFDGVLEAHRQGLTSLFIAGSRYDEEPTPCNAVISLRFLSWDILEERFDYELQRHAYLHLCVCALLGAYTHLERHEETRGCLLDFDNQLSDFNRKLQRGYYLCPDCDGKLRQDEERYGGSIRQLCSALKGDFDQQPTRLLQSVQIGELVMGDQFRDIRNANIAARGANVHVQIDGLNNAFELLKTVAQQADDEPTFTATAKNAALDLICSALKDVAKGQIKEAAKQIYELGRDIAPMIVNTAAYAFFRNMLQGG